MGGRMGRKEGGWGERRVTGARRFLVIAVSVPVCFTAAELGDLNPLLQRENYISHFHLIPNQTSELEHEMEENHEKLRYVCGKHIRYISMLCTHVLINTL